MIKCWLYIAILLLFFGCGKNSSSGHYGGKDTGAKNNLLAATESVPVNYNILIDNSASMDGYVINNTIENEPKFKSVLGSLASDIEVHLGGKPTISFITDKPYLQTLSETPSSFIHSLTPQKLKQNRIVTDTQIDSIINLCMNGLDSNINILTSDCIFSKKDAKKNVIPPQKAKDDLTVFVKRKLTNTNIATIVLKYNSDFSGMYYSESRNDTGLSLNQKIINRPFYVLIFGKSDNLLPMLSKINFHYPGFEASYCLMPNNINQAKLKTAISSEYRIGNFASQTPATNMVVYNATPNNGIFQFSIYANVSMPFEKSFLTNPSNYIIDSNFKIDSIREVTDQPDYTHIFTLKTTQLVQSQNIKLGVKYEVPDWIKNTGTIQDNNPSDPNQQHQTYGFTQLMEGLSQAYQNNSNLQFSIDVKVSTGKTGSGSSGFPWWILIVVMIAISIVIWLKNKS